MAYHIIRHCLFVPKLTYVLRCAPLWRFPNLIKPLDERIKDVLTKILNSDLSDSSWTQASLPIRYGGLGIRKISSIALPACISSAYSSTVLFQKIMHTWDNVSTPFVNEALNAWKMACPYEDIPTALNSQRCWDEPICRGLNTELISSSNSAGRARILAVSRKESGFWLQAIPSPNTGTLMDNTSFSLAINLRLGSRICAPHRCVCGTEVVDPGYHGLSCRRSAGRWSRHAALNDVLRRALADFDAVFADR